MRLTTQGSVPRTDPCEAPRLVTGLTSRAQRGGGTLRGSSHGPREWCPGAGGVRHVCRGLLGGLESRAGA